MTDTTHPVRDAATVLLLRDRPGGEFEVLLVKRHGQSGFMAGAHVFPGGKLDAADSHPDTTCRVLGRDAAQACQALGEKTHAGPLALGLFVAALRETFEEAGVLLADIGRMRDLELARLRLHGGASFGQVLGDLDARLRLDRVVPFSRWITPAAEPRRFDTRFFVAHVDATQQARHDARETTGHAWLTPTEAMDATARREVILPPPTLKTVLELAEYQTAAAVLDAARARRPPMVCPVIQPVDGTLTVLLPGDPLHPERVAVLSGGTRLVLEGGRFVPR